MAYGLGRNIASSKIPYIQSGPNNKRNLQATRMHRQFEVQVHTKYTQNKKAHEISL